MKTKEKLPSCREALTINLRAFTLLYKEYPTKMLSGLILAVWEAVTPYVGIYFSARILDELAGNRDINKLKNLVLLTLLSAAVIALLTALLKKWKTLTNSINFYDVEHLYCRKLLSMDFAVIDDPQTQACLSTIRQNDNGGGWGLQRTLWGYYESLLTAAFTISGGILLSISLFQNPVPADTGALTLLNQPVCILGVAGIMLIITFLAPMLAAKADSFIMSAASLHRLGNRLFGYFGYMGFQKNLAADMRMYRQDLICQKHSSDKKAIFHSQGPFAQYAKGPTGLLKAVSAAVSAIFPGVAYTFVCLKAWAGAFGIGSVTQYVAAISKVSGGVSTLVSTLGLLRNNAVFLQQTFAFLDLPNPMYQGSLTVEKRRDRDYQVEFRNVSFRYPGAKNYTLQNINMKFKIGERLAVVGMNGSGKTTFIKLLCRLYDPTEGEILLNGIDIRKYNYTDYLSVFSVVFQDFKLFSLPLGENIGGGINYDEALAMDCLKKAGFQARLEELPDGLATWLYKDCRSGGINVSGGEAAKIALARTLYKNAPFIILDEPTAALDPIAEAEVYSKFNEIIEDKTAIYISHRLSSCRFCDTIAVFDKGQIVQQGTHEELVAREGGKYRELWNAQAQYYV